MNIWYQWIAGQQIFLDYVYFSLHRFHDRFFTIKFTKRVMLLLPTLGRFYYALMNEFIHPLIKYTPPHMWYQKKVLQLANLLKINHMGLVDSNNQNHDFKCSVIYPVKQKLETKWWSSKQQLFHLATFLWIILSFCVDILTKCSTVFINKVIILDHLIRMTLGVFFVCENSTN